MHTEYTVRVAGHGDVPGWMRLVERVRDAFPGLEAAEALAAYRETLEKNVRRGTALCATCQGEVVGALLYSPHGATSAWRCTGTAGGNRPRLIGEMLAPPPGEGDVTVTTYRAEDPGRGAERCMHGSVCAGGPHRVRPPHRRFVLRRGRRGLCPPRERRSMPMETLETERLVLREWQETDLDDFHATQPQRGSAAGWAPPRPRALAPSSWPMDKGETWAIVHKADGRVIGSVGLHPDDLRTSVTNLKVKALGYVLSEDYWGQGLMTEAARRVLEYAFDTLWLDLLTVVHYPHNERSRRVVEMRILLRGHLRQASQMHDSTV